MQQQPSRPSSPISTAIPSISKYRSDVHRREVSKTHFEELGKYLPDYLVAAPPDFRPRARSKLTRLTAQQFRELSTDTYDELVRRKNEEEVPFLPVRADFHPKRNQARRKLSTLPRTRFEDLSSDVYFELERRYPEFKDDVHPPLTFVPVFRSSPARFKEVQGQEDLGLDDRSGDGLHGDYKRSAVDFMPLVDGNALYSRMMEVMEKMRRDHEFKIFMMQAQITNLQQALGDANDKKKESEARMRQLEKEFALRTKMQDSLLNDKLMSARDPGSKLIHDLEDNKYEYEQAKTELTSVEGTSQLILQSRESDKSEDQLHVVPNVSVQNIHIAAFLSSIDSLLSAGRSNAPIRLLTALKAVVNAIEGIIEDVKAYERRPQREVDLDALRSLRERTEATLSVLVAVTTTRTPSSGPSPFGLLNAAASHLSATVTEIGRMISTRRATEAKQEMASFSSILQLEEMEDDSISASYRSSDYSLASSRTATTDYGHYARRMALSQEIYRSDLFDDW